MTTLSLSVPRYAASSVSSSPVPALATGKSNSTRASSATRISPGLLTRAFQWVRTNTARSSKKRMQMIETVSLGEKRFVALVQVDDRHFLIGGASTNVGMLAEIGAGQTVEDALIEPVAKIKEEAKAQPDFQAQLLSATQAAALLEAPIDACTTDAENQDGLDAEEFIFPEVNFHPLDLRAHAQNGNMEALVKATVEVEANCKLATASEPIPEVAMEPVIDFYPANLASPIFYAPSAWTPELQGATS